MKTEEITKARKKAGATKVAVYHGKTAPSKTWATKFVDKVFQRSSPERLRKLSPENKKFVRHYLANGWYYSKYWDKLKALGIKPNRVIGKI